MTKRILGRLCSCGKSLPPRAQTYCGPECRKAAFKLRTPSLPSHSKEYRLAWYANNKDAAARAGRRWEYGPDADKHLDRMLVEQGGLCAICERVLTKPCLDHNHTTNQLRGALCNLCNMALGYLEKVGWIEKALSYLKKWKVT